MRHQDFDYGYDHDQHYYDHDQHHEGGLSIPRGKDGKPLRRTRGQRHHWHGRRRTTFGSVVGKIFLICVFIGMVLLFLQETANR